MMRPLLLGSLALCITGIISLFAKDILLWANLSAILGFGSWLLAGISSGVFSSHYHRFRSTEDKTEKERRYNYLSKLFLFGLPNIIVIIGIYLF